MCTAIPLAKKAMQKPSAPATPPKPAEVPRHASSQVKTAGDRVRRKQGGGRSSTLLTGGRGVTTPANTGTKTLMGE